MSSKKSKLRKKEFFVNVLGVPYKVHLGTEEDYPILKRCGSSGLCDYSIKKIWVTDTRLEQSDADDMSDQNYPTNLVLRHELVHAYLNESSMEEYAENERLVNVIAMALPKLYDMCKSAGAISYQERRKAA